jgi:hypothetical protein
LTIIEKIGGWYISKIIYLHILNLKNILTLGVIFLGNKYHTFWASFFLSNWLVKGIQAVKIDFFLILKVANIRCFILIAVEIFHNIIRTRAVRKVRGQVPIFLKNNVFFKICYSLSKCDVRYKKYVSDFNFLT